MKTLLFAFALTLMLPASTFADVDCSDVKSKNRDECVEAKRKKHDRDNEDRGDRASVESKSKGDREDLDKDDVKCRNAENERVRRECLKRKS